MSSRASFPASLAIVFLAAVLAGCGTKAANPPATPKASPKATAVPTELVAYARSAYPTLKSSISEANSILVKMERQAPSSVNTDCTTAGNDLYDQSSAFHGLFTPRGSHPIYQAGTAAYKQVLAAIDECGIAAEGSDTGTMATARSDLRSGIGQLVHVESMVSPWHAAKS